MDDDWILYENRKLASQVSRDSFYKALAVWIVKPHVINRRLCGTTIRHVQHCCTGNAIVNLPLFDRLHRHTHSGNNNQNMAINDDTSICNATGTDYSIQNRIYANLHCDGLKFIFDKPTENDLLTKSQVNLLAEKCLSDLTKDHNDGYTIIVRDLHSRNSSRFSDSHELIIIDFSTNSIVFEQLDDVNPHCCFNDNNIKMTKLYRLNMHMTPTFNVSLSIPNNSKRTQNELTHIWLKDTLLPKLGSWAAEPNLNLSPSSLRLISLEQYNRLYQRLKDKYAQKIIEQWTECTDPQKFVFEDIAIATYLLILWEQEYDSCDGTSKQTFVDLGCGNGLLVYLLASEGHEGFGVDLRRRKIWDILIPVANLKEVSEPDIPNSEFPECDWIIGNHSDELTPWIPVIASRSSYTCRFFVLPCCPYDFDQKFNSRVAGLSVYEAYLNFIEEVGGVCGFSVERDCLRIPSTKRVCLIGQMRTYRKDQSVSQNFRIQDYIKARTTRSALIQHASSKVDVPVTRNCQNLDPEFKKQTIQTVFDAVLAANKNSVISLDGQQTWRNGGVLSMREVVQLFNAEWMSTLCGESGGLQTLLRNQHQIFVVTKGTVSLRNPFTLLATKRKKNGNNVDISKFRKTSLCWFYMNHPDQCLLPAETCSYAHGVSDMMSSTRIRDSFS